MVPATASKTGSKALVQVMPEVPALSVSMLARLDPQQRELLHKLTTEQIEYVGHPSFTQPGGERELFGDTGADVSQSAALPSDILDDPSENQTPTLSAEEERRLFLRFNYARYRVFRIVDGAKGKGLTGPALAQLLTWAQRANDLRAAIVQINMPLVLAMAKRIRLNGVDFSELISEGNMALLRSVAKFDCSRGFKFSTYACRAILKSFSRVGMRMSRHRCRFPIEFDPNLERSDYLDRLREDQRNDCLEELQHILRENLAQLNDVEQTVIRERFSLDGPAPDGGKPKTLEQIGTLIGVTKERVRQIQNKALAKLRETLEDEFLVA
jgi:RNA polymerase primary sigma factor